jgi:predicted nucleic acid-binding Zn ribbon protein
MPDRIATMMIVQSLQEILGELKTMRQELQQLNQASRQAAEDRQRREPAPALTRFPVPRRTKSSP